VIGRSQDARHSVESIGVRQCRGHVRNSRRETHLGSGLVRPRQQTGHMIASDPIRTAASHRCRLGAVHIRFRAPRFARPRNDAGYDSNHGNAGLEQNFDQAMNEVFGPDRIGWETGRRN
jgi:hypothetical protein